MSFKSFSQDSIPAAVDLSEEKELKFQQFFFKSLSEKSIGNYQKAIENLESCNQILSNDVAVFFEFSKNYFYLNNSLLAKEYINRALTKEPNNIWMLEHLVKIYVKDKNFTEAINMQKRVVALNPKERVLLVKLYVYNKEYQKAVSLMNDLETDNALPANLKRLKGGLEKSEDKMVVEEEKSNDITSLINQFKTDKSYKILKQILQKSNNDFEVLLKYSEEGITLFPAQSYVYLMKGKALNYQKSYKKALSTLQNGIDFVIEDRMEANFYLEMAKAYKGLGNLNEEKKYIQKANKLKN
ncbi:hypothetical protein MC378_05600 [Polaribacter sp. MSW13]|uniref:Tetratricopeptide repeat-containing protein n=1 Tax=Polaribacter marinus TaxID=2916838 RepID=A0A9X1VLE1_9FLAO|nr:hypothetical protein [Polaribacter marinus]